MKIPNPSVLCRHHLFSNLRRTGLTSSTMTYTVEDSSTLRSISTGGGHIGNPISSSATAPEGKPKTEAALLPKLPVPRLNDTLSKLLRTVKPLVSPEEFERANKLAQDFASENGPKLQRLLEERAAQTDNWLSDWWLDAAYLEFRSPVIVHSSPGLVFPLEEFKNTDDQLRYAAKLIYGALCYKRTIDRMTMAPDMMGKQPLDMSQYGKVLGTNRRPTIPKDELTFNPLSQHIVVAYKNYYFKTPVYTEKGEIVDPTQLYYELKLIVNGTTGLNGPPVGVLTTDHRDTWAQVYHVLGKDAQNAETIKHIEESLFLVCIDRPNRPLMNPKRGVCEKGVEDFDKSEKQTVAALQMIHGNRTNSGNRWFDKTIQFIIGPEGECGLTYEHSPAEGPPIANMMDFIVNNQSKFESLLPVKTDDEEVIPRCLPKKLPFNVTEKMSKYITESGNALGNLVDDLDMACFTFRKYGKDFIKSCQLSPDSYIQMAIQASFYRIHGVPGAHYESASTRMYDAGRTECIRSCSIESLEFAKALVNNSLSPQEKLQTMKKAIESHKRYAAEAVQGFGVDRHILGLKLISRANSIELHPFFTDEGVLKSGHFRLSTSQVPSVNQAFMCYGPLVPNGYGCCYNPRASDMSFGISAFNSSTETNAEQFKISLQQSLLDMQTIAALNRQSKL